VTDPGVFNGLRFARHACPVTNRCHLLTLPAKCHTISTPFVSQEKRCRRRINLDA
jgi:hypothetical protein